MKLYVNSKFHLLLFLVVGLLFAVPKYAVSQTLSAQAVAAKNQVYVGEAFVFQIQVQGDDQPEQPVLSQLNDFSVQFSGGQQNSSSSVTIINGRMQQHVRRGYVFSYRLTPKRSGVLTIPEIEVSAAGKLLLTQALSIRVLKPAQSRDFKLSMKLSSSRVYVGQPVRLSITWYIGRDVEGFEFSLPFVEDSRFTAKPLSVQVDPNQAGRYIRIPLVNGEMIGKKGSARLGSREVIAVSFQYVLIAQQAGTFKIPQSTVSANVINGYQQRGSRDPFFDSFFKDSFLFGRQRSALTKKFITPSNKPLLEVLELPREGRPADFNGLVGKYSIASSAKPDKVRVGDPITLNIKVTGPDYLENIELPPLNKNQTLTRDFKVPQEMAPGIIEGRVKTFTQTIRAKHSQIKEIPALELAYFDAEQGKYALAKSNPISLFVETARVITAADAEGRELPEIRSAELQTWTKGIAHNYEDASILEDQEYGLRGRLFSLLVILLLVLPPGIYFILFVYVRTRAKQLADPLSRKAKKAFTVLSAQLAEAKRLAENNPEQSYHTAWEALGEYLSSKLYLSLGTLTFRDVQAPLSEQAVDQQTIDALKQLFSTHEARRFARISGDCAEVNLLIDQTMRAAKDLEKALK